MKRLLAAAAAGLVLSACGASGPTAETYTGSGFEVTQSDAEALDLSAYPTTPEGLYSLYLDVGATYCEEGLAPRDINNAIYLDCDAPVSIRMHADEDAASSAAEHYAQVNAGATVYRTGNITVTGTPGDVNAFINTFKE